jgi:ParB family chromosome partitioning protein
VSPRRGLPDSVKSRFESHYVDELATSLPEPLGRFIPLKLIRPDENQPRGDLGDLSGLKQSIKSKGIIEPIVVRHAGEFYQIISGERRYLAARELGLDEVPCVVREADDLEALEVALIENLQRKDLTPFEEADGYKQLIEKHSYKHEEISERIGKSRTSVTETLSLTRIPEDIRGLCSKHGISAKSMLLQIARQDTASDMLELTQQIVSHGISRAEARARRPHLVTARAKPHTFNFNPPDRSFKVTVRFSKNEVSDEETKAALQAAIDHIDNHIK